MLASELDRAHQRRRHLPLAYPEPHQAGRPSRPIIAAGELVGDDIVEEVVKERLTQHDWNYGFILDGFPATSARPSSSSRATTSTP